MLYYKEFENAELVQEFFNNVPSSVNIYHKPVAITRNKFDRFDVFYENVYYNSDVYGDNDIYYNSDCIEEDEDITDN